MESGKKIAFIPRAAKRKKKHVLGNTLVDEIIQIILSKRLYKY